MLADWAYARAYRHSRERARALAPLLTFYNFERRHTTLGFVPSASRFAAFL
jgi:hypothetical protein